MDNKVEIVAILLTCHNRKDTTLTCLKSIYNQDAIEGLRKEVIIVDDGSTDGTSEEIKNKFPEVQIIAGNGNLFWNHGMRLAMETAMSKGYDYYLWLNDDVKLHPMALSTLYSTYKQTSSQGYKKSIIVGSTQDEESGEVTYGGFVRSSKYHPLRFRLIEPQDKAIPCDNFHGNIVFIPDNVAKKVGNLEPEFHHQGGDHDYALRARKMAVALWLTPGYLGYCPRNEYRFSWQQPNLGFMERIKLATGSKCLPWRTRKVYIKRHGGFLWPLWWIAPYVKIVFAHFYYNLKNRNLK